MHPSPLLHTSLLPSAAVAYRRSLFDGAVMLCATIVALLILTVVPLSAQRFDHYWYFGNGAGIVFSGTSAVSIPGGKTMANEGVAVVSDPITHNRVFYTDGATVWDSTHQVIPIPGGLSGGVSSTQSAVIVPVPGYSRRYYVFTTGEAEGGDNVTVGLRYTVLDFNDPTFLIAHNVPLLAPSTEKVTAVRHCNGEDYWIIAHGWGNNEFHAYLLTSQGLDPTVNVVSSIGPVLSSTGTPAGYLTASSDGRMLGMAVYYPGNYAGVFSFNTSTGRVTSEIPVLRNQDGLGAYGICFSPNGSRLYVSTQDASVQGTGLMLQFDLASNNPTTIAASRETLFVGGSFGAIEPGLDGRLYIARFSSSSLSIVGNPDALGAACSFRYNGFALTTGTSTFGLPNVIVAVGGGAAHIVGDLDLGPDTAFCPGLPIQLHASGADQYQWSPPYGLSCTTCPDPYASPDTTTTYIVTGYAGVGCIRTDTITVRIDSNRLPIRALGTAQQICAGAEATLTADAPPDAHVRWSASTPIACDTCRSVSVRALETTVYYLEAWTDDGCRGRDSVAVFVKAGEPLPITVTGSTTLCPGDTTTIHVDLPPGGARVRWRPSTDLACDTCATTAAYPQTQTTYVAELLSETDCYARDSVTIRFVNPVAVTATLGPEVALRPGTPALIPVQLSGIPAGVGLAELDIVLRYNPLMLRLRSVQPSGPIAGWTASNEQNNRQAGTYSARFTSPASGTFDRNGEVLRLEFASYYGDTVLASRLEMESMALRGAGCVKVGAASVVVRLDSLCWGMMRGIETLPFGSDKLISVHPAPASERVQVLLNVAEAGTLSLDAVDPAGVSHHLGGGSVSEGEHELTVSVGELASGVYHLVVRRGDRVLGVRQLLVTR